MEKAAWIMLLTASLLAAAPAAARPGEGRGSGMGPGSRLSAERQEARPQRGERYADEAAGAGRADVARERCDGPCRMTREERMQLRRDIDDAGRDLYRRGPRRGRD